MAQKRMLNKSISLSRKANKLPLKLAFIYTWMLPHLDDHGLIERDSNVLKGMAFPMKKEITAKDILGFIEIAQIHDEKGESLITEHGDCLEFNGFEDHQTISPEKRAKSKFSRIPKNPQESPRSSQIREVKLREENLIEKNIYGEFQNVFLSEEEYQALCGYCGTENNLKLLIVELSGYIKNQKKDPYLDHYATLQTWWRREAKKHVEKLPTKKIGSV